LLEDDEDEHSSCFSDEKNNEANASDLSDEDKSMHLPTTIQIQNLNFDKQVRNLIFIRMLT